ncbi:DUF4442 domain-containing protein [Suttonella sp. R2A3]|uniref:DUF4442 domain-containing protein n=1 Tax=Suttonella sp. R2A3 TaxID=2908648 RepID=UPI001F3BC46D|nr:DUF4442 domain-containing protein [Suttonella sp. R2A3]UJF24063.1 DUF4442 domain-containing protein [Suttonella sp. R2A3]
MKAWLFRHPNVLRWVFNFWPPFLFTGIWVEAINREFTYARVRLRSSPFTRNINGSQYGGSLFSMTDPVYATLMLGVLGWQRYYIWDRAATVEYIAPGHGPVFFEAKISEAFIEEACAATESGEKYEPIIHGQIVDRKGTVVAEVTRTLYIRLRPKYRPNND